MPNTIKQHNYPHTAKIVFEEQNGRVSATMILPDEKDSPEKKIVLPLSFLCDAVNLKSDEKIRDGETITVTRLKKAPLRFNDEVFLSFYCGPGHWVEIPRKSLCKILRDYEFLPPKKKKTAR